MADLVFTIPDQYVADVLDAFADKYEYREEIEVDDPDSDMPGMYITVPNPQTKAQFAKQVILNHIKTVYVQYKEKIDTQAAVDAVTVIATTESDTFTGA